MSFKASLDELSRQINGCDQLIHYLEGITLYIEC